MTDTPFNKNIKAIREMILCEKIEETKFSPQIKEKNIKVWQIDVMQWTESASTNAEVVIHIQIKSQHYLYFVNYYRIYEEKHVVFIGEIVSSL